MKKISEEYILLFDAISQDAKILFDKLEKRLAPKCMIIRIIEDENKKNRKILLQIERDKITSNPHEYGYSSDFFEKIKDLEKEYEKSNNINLSDLVDNYSDFNQNYKSVIKNISYIDAVETVLNNEKINSETVSFCSYPVIVDGYITFSVVQLNKSTFDCYYKLNKISSPRKYVAINRYAQSTSLLRSVTTRFLRKSTTYFNNLEVFYRSIVPIFFHNLGNETEIDAIIISSGQYLIHSVAKSVISESGVSLINRKDLFYTFNEISLLRYEGSEGNGRIAICDRNHPNIRETVTFKKPIKIDDFSAVRKVLQITSDEMFLISNSHYIFGIGEMIGDYNEELEDLFFVKFLRHNTWELTHGENVLMLVSYGQPKLPKFQAYKIGFSNLLNQIFPGIAKNNIARLWDLINRATQQKHGTMVVITKDAEDEGLRLQSQAILIKPINITLEMVDKMTEIDGAILINPFDLNCYAIGVILDGLASDKGNSARGARYNSAVRYCEAKQGTCLAIVVSEDGAIDLIY